MVRSRRPAKAFVGRLLAKVPGLRRHGPIREIGNTSMQNFTVADLVQTTFATLAFAVFLLPPGYLLGLAGNLFGMRSRSAAEKLLFSVAFSIATTPIVAVLLTRVTSYQVTISFFLLLALISLGTLVRQLPKAPALLSGIQRSTWLMLGMLLVWFLIVQFSLADLQIDHRLYVNFVVYDHSVRIPLVEAAARSGVPPRNPFYGLGQPPILRYFYYWYVVCALPVRLFGLPAKACLDASVFWSGLGVASLVPLFLKHFFGEDEKLREMSLIGVALLAVTGLDLLAYAAWAGYYRLILPDMEWWDTNQVTSWMGSLLWVPHHVASMTACMAGLLALSSIEEDAPLRKTGWAVLISALAFASGAGLSIYVVFAFAIFLVAWTLATLLEKKFQTFLAYLSCGVLVLFLSWPYLLDMLSKSVATTSVGAVAAAVPSGGDRFAFVAIRDFFLGLQVLNAFGVQSPWLLELSKLLMLVPVYVVEFGFFALVVPLYRRRERRLHGRFSRQRRMAWILFTVCLLVLSFVKSDTSGSNDLGFRGMLVVQFVLLVWAAPIVYEVFFDYNKTAITKPDDGHAGQVGPAPLARPSWIKKALLCTLIIGVAGSAVQLLLLRFYAPLVDTGKVQSVERTLGSPGFGARTYWLRDGFGRLNGLTSPRATVQYNPVRDEVLITHVYSLRQAAMGDSFCGSAFGGDADRCRKVLPIFAAVFNNPELVRSWDLDRFCNDFQLNLLVATNADPVWQDPDSWVWNRQSLLANPGMRAIPCGTVSY